MNILRLVAVAWICATGPLASAGAPTDNPIAAFYDGPEGYPAWTDGIPWDNVIDMSQYARGTTQFEKFESARDALAVKGGGGGNKAFIESYSVPVRGLLIAWNETNGNVGAHNARLEEDAVYIGNKAAKVLGKGGQDLPEGRPAAPANVKAEIHQGDAAIRLDGDVRGDATGRGSCNPPPIGNNGSGGCRGGVKMHIIGAILSRVRIIMSR
jgi:hypothetical protein